MDNKINTTPNGQQPAAQYDDGNIPDVDLPRGEDVVSPVVPMPGFTQPINTGIGEE